MDSLLRVESKEVKIEEESNQSNYWHKLIIKLHDLQVCFVLLSGGSILSILVFLIEVTIMYLSK
jgi:hypothetical protein